MRRKLMPSFDLYEYTKFLSQVALAIIAINSVIYDD